MEIGDQLKKIREFRGLGVNQLGRLAGVPGSTISQWEHGKHQPRPEPLKKVLDVLGISFEQLFQDFDSVFVKEALEKYKTDSKDIEVVLTADPALSPADVEIIMHIVLAKERELAEKEKGDKPE